MTSSPLDGHNIIIFSYIVQPWAWIPDLRDAQILSDQASQWLLLLTAAIPRRVEVVVLLARTLLPWSLASWTGMKLAISFQIVVVLLLSCL